MEEVTLRSLYLKEGLSAKQIADRLEVPESKVVYWLRKYQIPKRSLSEAVYRRINQGGDPFDVKTELSLEEEKLKVAGLLLWVTEGSVKDKEAVYTTNSDPALISLFIEFLLRVCQIYQAAHNYRAKSKYGTATVSVGNIKLRAQMEMWLNELYDNLR